MSEPHSQPAGRFDRQVVYEPFGRAGQERLARGRALIVGLGGLGCAAAESLARSGVGRLRLVDDDVVALENLHRQVLFDEADAAAAAPKVLAAARRIARINGQVRTEPVEVRLDAANAAELAADVDVIVDGTDNFPTRFLINDLAVEQGIPWVFAGVIGAEAQTMTVLPGRTPCLRCVFDSPPPPGTEVTCRTAGVLPPAVAAVAAIEALEAIKVLSGHAEAASPHLVKFDLWTGSIQRIDLAEACADVDCPCCKQRRFDFLHPPC